MKQITLTLIVCIIIYTTLISLAHNFGYFSIKNPLYWVFVVLPAIITGFNIPIIYNYFEKWQ